MAKDDYFKIIYAILTELYETMKAGEKLNVVSISPTRFQISDSYWLDIIEELIQDGYVKGVSIYQTKTGRVVSEIESIRITSKGIEYLQNNSAIQKVKEALKNIKDIVPGI